VNSVPRPVLSVFLIVFIVLASQFTIFHFVFSSYAGSASARSIAIESSGDALTATGSAPQVKLFHDNLTNGHWWYFYNNETWDSNDAGVCYRTSSDGATWSSEQTTPLPLGGYVPYINATGLDFEIAYNPNYDYSYVYCVFLANNSAATYANCAVWFCRGTISGGSITWGTAHRILAGQGVNDYWSYANCAVMDNGTVLAGFNNYSVLYSREYYEVYLDSNDDGSGNWTSQVGSEIGLAVGNWYSGTIQLLSNASNGKQQILVVYANTVNTSYFRCNYYNGTNWSGEMNVTTSRLSERFFGATSWGNYTLIDYVNSSWNVNWQLFNATSSSWYGEHTAASNTTTPGIYSIGEISQDPMTNCSWCTYKVNTATGDAIDYFIWYSVASCSSPVQFEDTSAWPCDNTIIQSPRMYSFGCGLAWEYYQSGILNFDVYSQPINQVTYSWPVLSYSTSAAGTNCTFSALWTVIPNGFNLSMAFYSTNITGAWVYNTSASLTFVSSASAWANWTYVLPAAGTVVDYYWICNATSNYWNATMPLQSMTAITQFSYSVTTLGTTTSNGYSAGGSAQAPVFDGCIVFWRNLTSYFNLTAFNLTSNTFSDVYTSQGKGWPGGASPATSATCVIADRLYVGYGWPTGLGGSDQRYSSTVIYTSDLSTFTTLGNVSMALESICNYTGGGNYKNKLYFGGFQDVGQGTYAQIDCWNNGKDRRMYTGTVLGSDDTCFLTMFNSTCMIGSDTAPNNVIYTNNGVNFVDEWSPSTAPYYTSQYPFVWAWGCFVNSTYGTAYMAASASPLVVNYWGDYFGGMATWNGVGTYTSSSWKPLNLFTVATSLAGGSDNVLNSTTWTGHPAIYAYTPTGGFGYQVWKNASDTGAVLSLTYNSNGIWYGLYYDAISQNVTLIKITVSTSGGVPEFQDAMILSLFAISLIVVAALKKRFFSTSHPRI